VDDMEKLKITIASDHAGFELKGGIIKHLESKGFSVKDLGTNSAESCDYPDFAKAVAKEVASKNSDYGILICGTGIGMSIAANKTKGIRAALVHDEFTAKAAKEHNNANVLCFGSRIVSESMAKKIIDLFFGTKFLGETKEGERHKKRVEKIE